MIVNVSSIPPVSNDKLMINKNLESNYQVNKQKLHDQSIKMITQKGDKTHRVATWKLLMMRLKKIFGSHPTCNVAIKWLNFRVREWK